MKKNLANHKKCWDSHLIYAVWANRITPKGTTRKYPFGLFYGKDGIFPTNLDFLVWKFLQESNDEPNDFARSINQIIVLNENGDEVQYKLKKYQNKMKSLFDRKSKDGDFKEGCLVPRWDSRREVKGKHGYFDNLCLRSLSMIKVRENNTFVLQNLEGQYSTFPFNGRFLGHYIQYWGVSNRFYDHHCNNSRFNLPFQLSNYFLQKMLQGPRRRHMDLQFLSIL